jgi:hypothetical protein
MKDLLDDTADVSTTLSVVDGTELHGALAGAHMSFEDGGLSPPLGLLVPFRLISSIDMVCIIQSPISGAVASQH